MKWSLGRNGADQSDEKHPVLVQSEWLIGLIELAPLQGGHVLSDKV